MAAIFYLCIVATADVSVAQLVLQLSSLTVFPAFSAHYHCSIHASRLALYVRQSAVLLRCVSEAPLILFITPLALEMVLTAHICPSG
ncbi:hypothetical protein [Aeromonas veronii]|uniref:hypothetical protein n=1 Tax=Aeromonas veronii TaxID=654 RepID=UPI003D218ACB